MSSGGLSAMPPLRGAAATVSLSLAVLLALAYASRADAVAAVTLFPTWAWAIAGLLLALPAMWRPSRRFGLFVAAVWCIFAASFADEPASLLRGAVRSWIGSDANEHGGAWRIITLNAAGDTRAAAEVAPWSPDVVLLQESPSRDEVGRLAKRLFGADACWRHHGDVSILARGRAVEDAPLAQGSHFVAMRVRLASGHEAEIVSLRLDTPSVRFDLWSPACWRAQTEIRRRQRHQLQAVVNHLAGVPKDVLRIVGGDFNCPPRDAIFRLFRGQLRDTFAIAGIGWGNTIMNDVPLMRIDQVWTSNELALQTVVAARTERSDHRMVVCDVRLANTQGRAAGSQ